MNNLEPHYHKAKVWEIFPAKMRCDGRHLGDPEMEDHWLNGWIFEAFNWVVFTFMIYVCGIDNPQFKIWMDSDH